MKLKDLNDLPVDSNAQWREVQIHLEKIIKLINEIQPELGNNKVGIQFFERIKSVIISMFFISISGNDYQKDYSIATLSIIVNLGKELQNVVWKLSKYRSN